MTTYLNQHEIALLDKSEQPDRYAVPELQKVNWACDGLWEDGVDKPIGPHNELGQGLPQEGVQPEANCLGCVRAAQCLSKIQLEVQQRWFPVGRRGPFTQSTIA